MRNSVVFFILDSSRKADLGLLVFYIKGGGPARKEKHHFLAKELKYIYFVHLAV